MSSLPQHINEEWFNRKVRQTEDGRASVLDLIKGATTGQRGERQIWDRLKQTHPELEALVCNVRFPDIGGRISGKPTPVVDLQGWLQILALLPGAAGRKYRQETAQLIVRIWRGDADLGLAIMLRDTDKRRLERAKARLRVCDFNKKVTRVSLENNERPDRVHDARYLGYYHKRTGQVRTEMNIAKDETPLDFMDTGELAVQEAIQYFALKAVEQKGGKLQTEVFSVARQMSNIHMAAVGSVPTLPDPIKVGYMDPKEARVIKASDDAGQMSMAFA